MIETLAQKITDFQQKKPRQVIVVFLIITALLLPGIFLLINNVEPSLEKVLPTSIPEVQTMNSMRDQFGADMMYLVFTPQDTITDLRNPQVLQYLDTVGTYIQEREHILEVQSLATLVKNYNNGIIPNSPTEINSLLATLPQTSSFTNYDYSLSVMIIRSDTGSSAELISTVVDSIKEDLALLDTENPGVNVQLTGYNAIDKATFEIIISDFGKITLVSFVIVALTVFITFRSIKKGVLPLTVVMVSLIWTMGIVGYLGLTLTVVSMVAAAMILGLGIDFGIHVVLGFYGHRKDKSLNEAMKETSQELLRAMVGASSTTILGFLALLFGFLPAMKTLGIILAIGIINTLFAAVLLLPVLIFLQEKKKEEHNNE